MDLKGILDALIETLRSEVPDFNSLTAEKAHDQVREYKGEYEPNGEWTPAFPTCFIDTALITPLSYASDDSVTNVSVVFDLYIANRFNQTDHILNTVGRIFDVLNSGNVEIDDHVYFFKIGKIQFLGNTNEVKVYKMQITSL